MRGAKPLTRSFRGNKAQQQSESAEQEPRTRIYRQPCRRRFDDGKMHTYLFEVHDFIDNKAHGDRFWANIRDITKQTALEVPYSMTKPLIEHLLSCKTDAVELEHEDDEETEAGPTHKVSETHFDLKALENKRIMGLDNTIALEIADAPETKDAKLLICEPLGKDAKPSADGDVAKVQANSEKDDLRLIMKPKSKKGSILVTEWLLPRLVLFLKDVNTRHMTFANGYPSVRNIYAPSGSRRFFFDIMETHWGGRLQISQVTAQHRNVISVPMENLVLFRNRLNRLIRQLDLDESTDIKIARAPRPKRDASASAQKPRGKPVRPRPVALRRFRYRGPRPASSRAPASSAPAPAAADSAQE